MHIYVYFITNNFFVKASYITYSNRLFCESLLCTSHCNLSLQLSKADFINSLKVSVHILYHLKVGNQLLKIWESSSSDGSLLVSFGEIYITISLKNWRYIWKGSHLHCLFDCISTLFINFFSVCCALSLTSLDKAVLHQVQISMLTFHLSIIHYLYMPSMFILSCFPLITYSQK